LILLGTGRDLETLYLSRRISRTVIAVAVFLFAPAAAREWHHAIPRVTFSAAVEAREEKSEERILHFPDRNSLGRLIWFQAGKHFSRESYVRSCHDVGLAQGAVHVPKMARLALRVSYSAATNPELLIAYGSDFFAFLDFSKIETDDRTMAAISSLTGLHALDLRDSDLSDQGLRWLSHLKNLEYLYLGRTRITDQGLQWLLPLGSLQELVLSQTKIGDSGLRIIQKCRALQGLSISRCQITDAGLPFLATLPELSRLDLSNNRKVTANGLLQLSGLKRLHWLSLRNTSITAKDLQMIKQLCQKIPSLNFIDIGDKSFTAASLTQWRQAIPHVSIALKPETDLQAKSLSVFAPLR
jgi:hypothetical protein